MGIDEFNNDTQHVVVIESWNRVIHKLLEDEGLASNHKEDNGGATWRGVTLKAWREYKQDDSISFSELQATPMSEIKRFYNKMYWKPIQGDVLPVGLDYVVFDMSVNSGPTKAIKTLQKALGVEADGKIGPKTLAAIRGCDVKATIRKFQSDRLSFMQRLSDWTYFGRGWKRRVSEVEQDALNMIA